MARIDFNASNHKPFGAGAPVAIEDQARDNTRSWSAYQTRVFDFVEHGTGNAIVRAVAGSGKTTTIVEALKRVRGSSLFLAFNKSIADELKSRGVNARTFHSLTYSAVTKYMGVREVDSNKLRKLCDKYMTGIDFEYYAAFVCRLVGLARQVGIGCLVPDTEQAWMDLCIQHDLEPESEFADLGRGLELAQKLLQVSCTEGGVDFDDLLYLAVKEGISLPKFDFVFVDEAQDTNAIQRALLRKVMHQNSRMVAVGDSAQAIYGFRGADSQSMNLIASEFNCIELPLTITYRCSLAVVRYAQQWCPELEAAPNAPEGEVLELGRTWNVNTFEASDMIVCRTTAPIITLAFKMLRAKIPVRVMGREIGQGLKNLINKMNAGNLEHLEAKLEAWRDREVEKLTAKMEETKAEAVADKVACILCLIDALPETERTMFGLMQTIDSLFAEGTNQVKLSTIHKAKGLEAKRVFWLNRSKCPSPWARQEWQQEQERNLCNVATTRAIITLAIIEEEEK
jgi:DNA helicase-2/ATP-dependent DNA helicase PcrA